MNPKNVAFINAAKNFLKSNLVAGFAIVTANLLVHR